VFRKKSLATGGKFIRNICKIELICNSFVLHHKWLKQCAAAICLESTEKRLRNSSSRGDSQRRKKKVENATRTSKKHFKLLGASYSLSSETPSMVNSLTVSVCRFFFGRSDIDRCLLAKSAPYGEQKREIKAKRETLNR
jgi:hypothetical protein